MVYFERRKKNEWHVSYNGDYSRLYYHERIWVEHKHLAVLGRSYLPTNIFLSRKVGLHLMDVFVICKNLKEATRIFRQFVRHVGHLASRVIKQKLTILIGDRYYVFISEDQVDYKMRGICNYEAWKGEYFEKVLDGYEELLYGRKENENAEN